MIAERVSERILDDGALFVGAELVAID